MRVLMAACLDSQPNQATGRHNKERRVGRERERESERESERERDEMYIHVLYMHI